MTGERCSGSSLKSNNRKLSILFARLRKRKDVENPKESPVLPSLPLEIKEHILRFLPFDDLFYARGVSQWFYRVCLEHIYNHYLKHARVLFNYWSCVSGFQGPFLGRHRFNLEPEPGNLIIKLTRQGFSFTDVCGGIIEFFFPNGEIRSTFARFAGCSHRRPSLNKWSIKRFTKESRLGLQEVLLWSHQKDTHLSTKVVGKAMYGYINSGEIVGAAEWEMYIPLYRLISMSTEQTRWY